MQYRKDVGRQSSIQQCRRCKLYVEYAPGPTCHRRHSNISKGRFECVGRILDIGIKCRVDESQINVDTR